MMSGEEFENLIKNLEDNKSDALVHAVYVPKLNKIITMNPWSSVHKYILSHFHHPLYP